MKILCLHGYTQSGSLFARKASGLRKSLKKAGHELTFIDGPLQVELSDLPFEPSPDMAEADMRAWWSVKEGDARYGDTSRAFETVKAAVEEHGPFDGILGFSQGAGLTALLLKALPQLVPSHPPIKFAVMYSSFKLKAESAQHWYDSKFTTPALHIMGTLDTVVPEERSMQLVECWEPGKASVLKHPGGHYTPSQRPMLEAVQAFVQKQAEPAEDKAEQTKDEDWNAFDSIGK